MNWIRVYKINLDIFDSYLAYFKIWIPPEIYKDTSDSW